MMWKPTLVVLATILVFSACSGDQTPGAMDRGGVTLPDGAGAPDRGPTPDRGPGKDSAPPLDGMPADQQTPDGAPPDAGPADGCVTGSPDHCATCGDKCPGPDNTGTRRVCNAGTCDIQCKDAWYDTNGQVADGCETYDGLDAYATEAAAKDLGSFSDCDNAQALTVALPSDGRYHVDSPHDRTLGTPKWFKLQITDKSFCLVDAKITASFKNLPAAGTYRVTGQYTCKTSGKKLPQQTKTDKGTATVTVKPSTSCTTMGDDSGTLLVQVSKQSGAAAHTSKQLALSIEP